MSTDTEFAVSRRLRVLVVEDHEDSLEMMSILLDLWGYDVTTARSIESALQASRAAEFDCVISDLGLPDGSGLQLIQKLRENRSINGIALSGSVQEKDVQASLNAGFQRHLAKPLDVAELEAALAALSA